MRVIRSTLTILIFAALTLNTFLAPVVQALNNDDIRSLLNDTVWYKQSSGGGICTVNLAADLSGNDNIEKAFRFFVQKGLTAIQSAGIVGNMVHESGVDPENIQNPGGRSKNPEDAGNQGWGIVQWTPGRKVIDIAKSANITTPIYELGTQLEIVWAQLTRLGGLEQQAGDDIKKTAVVLDAVLAFQGNTDPSAGKYRGSFVGFERPDDQGGSVDRRLEYANDILDLYGDSIGGETVGAPPSGGGCSITGPGQASQYVDGFIVYSQYDPRWANLKYGTKTIADSGCGPAAMAMIITALTGKAVTPNITAAYADSQNLYVPGAGSSWSIAPVLAERWKLNSSPIGKDIAKITATLQAGGLVIASGQGPKPFTEGGHYIVIRGVTANGMWKIGDSAHDDTSDKEWDPQMLIRYMNDGSVYAITK